MKTEIFVVTAAYGNDQVLALGGQAALIPMIAAAGAAGVEIRRELCSETDLKNLPLLAQTIADAGLRVFYSAPEPLYTEAGQLNPLLPRLLDEARQLGATRLKISLGHFAAGPLPPALAKLLAACQVRLMIENDQTSCGRLAVLQLFFQAIAAANIPITMTFDMGNWRWTGEDAQPAAAALKQAVSYIHVKVAERQQDGWRAVPPNADDPQWRSLLAWLGQDIPLGIEFPLQGDDLLAVTRHYVSLLQQEHRS